MSDGHDLSDVWLLLKPLDVHAKRLHDIAA